MNSWRLSVFDADLPVVMPGEDTDFCEVKAAYRDLVAWVDGEVQLSDERDRDCTPVVRLFGGAPGPRLLAQCRRRHRKIRIPIAYAAPNDGRR